MNLSVTAPTPILLQEEYPHPMKLPNSGGRELSFCLFASKHMVNNLPYSTGCRANSGHST
jgi:hypothetical protein